MNGAGSVAKDREATRSMAVRQTTKRMGRKRDMLHCIYNNSRPDDLAAHSEPRSTQVEAIEVKQGRIEDTWEEDPTGWTGVQSRPSIWKWARVRRSGPG